MSNHNNEMKKTLGLSTALATVVGSVIGWETINNCFYFFRGYGTPADMWVC